MRGRMEGMVPVVTLGAFFVPSIAYAAGPTAGSSPIHYAVLLAVLGLLPFVLIMVTSFVKVAVVLSILRTAIGVQQAPPNQVITGLAIILSFYIMAPVAEDAYEAVAPEVIALERGEVEGGIEVYSGILLRAAAPLRSFLIKHADDVERSNLYALALDLRAGREGTHEETSVADDDFMVLIPAFVLTELKEAFTIGFVLFVPFIVLDLVVANVLLSLGMHMLSPTTISLPFKLLLFVLVDGWFLVIKGLIVGYL